MFKGRSIVLGVTGSVAAFKACELLRLFTKSGACVKVILTPFATRFVTPLTFAALGAKEVFTDETWKDAPLSHIRVTEGADLFLVAPASADILAKAANGIADDFLSTALLAAACPIFFAPAMNARMWENPATKRNVQTLLSDGKHILGPVTGTLACETSGAGRMLEPETIYEALCAATHPKILEKCRVLITAGATAEPIDPVRVITNRSSGKQGFAVARAFAMAGAEVTLIAGKTNEATPLGVKRIDVTSAQEMFEAVKREVSDNEVFISVAAVSDWRVKNASSHKIKKAFSGIPHIELEENPDILAYVAKLPDAPFCVGFAAETENLIENALAKLFTKGVSLIVANLVADALETQTTSVVFVTADEAKPLANTTKEAVAEALAQAVSRFVN